MDFAQIEFRDDYSSNLSKVTGHTESLAGLSYSGGHETATLHDDSTSAAERDKLDRIFAPKDVLVGRDNEVKQLQDAFSRISAEGGPSEVVLLAGSSGSGKTSLIETSLRTQVAKSNGFFVAGKCEQVRTHVPFPALTSVLSDLCDLLSQEDSLPSIRARLTEAVGGCEAAALSSLVSSIGRVIGDEYLGGVSSGSNMTQTFQRFKAGCKLFVRSIASHSHPIVIFLDDLQWIDHESQEILRDLVSDQSCYVLLIGAYRHDEATSQEVVEMFQFGTDRFHLHTTRITLSNLDNRAVNELVAASLCMPSQTVTELSDVIYSKTNGNPFYTKELLGFLEYEHLIRYNEDTEEWAWDAKDISAIRNEINVADNVLKILEQKLDRLPPEAQKLLTVASYIGFFFRENVLTDFIVEDVAESNSASNARKQVKETLCSATKEGLIEEAGANCYRFAHDKIQQCVLEKVTGDDHISLSYRLGWFLHAGIPSYGEQEVFPAAENLIKGLALTTGPEERLNVARICLTAGLAAKGLSSFHSAAEFAGAGLDILGTATLPWTTHYDFVMALCILAVESRQALGKIDDARDIIAGVLENAKSNCEKWPAHKAIIEDLATGGDYPAALQKSLVTLREYGDPYPKKPNLIHLIRQYLRVKRLLKSMGDDDLLNLPELTDANLITTVEVYNGITLQSFLTYDELNFALSALRGIEFSIRHGYSVVTPNCFVCFGIVCCSLGDVSLGNRYGNLAVRMLDHWKFVQGRARVYLTREGVFFHLRHTAKACADGLKVGALDGFKSGEHEDAMYCSCLYAQYIYNSGVNLSEVAHELSQVIDKFSMIKRYAVNYMRIFMAATSNLLGESEDPETLTNNMVDEQEALQLVIDADDKLGQFTFRSLKASLLFRFGDVEAAYGYAEKLRKEKRLGLQDDLNLLYFGLTYVDMYRRFDRKRKFLSRARRSLKGLRRDGVENPNTKASFYLLNAELYVIMSKTATEDSVLEKYELAATAASEAGLPQFEALANERAALAISCLNFDLAVEHMARAKEVYFNWGANAIVEYLDERGMMQGSFHGAT